MKLQSLAGAEAPAGCGDVEIAGITADSRQVRPGWLFAAMPGSKADGARFVPEALAKGAAADPRRGREPRSPCRRAWPCSARPSRAGRWR